jgi:hypothetical protein
MVRRMHDLDRGELLEGGHTYVSALFAVIMPEKKKEQEEEEEEEKEE